MYSLLGLWASTDGAKFGDLAAGCDDPSWFLPTRSGDRSASHRGCRLLSAPAVDLQASGFLKRRENALRMRAAVYIRLMARGCGDLGGCPSKIRLDRPV